MKQPRRGIPRREFVKSAIAIGGSSALAACMDQETAANESPSHPRGPTDLSGLPERQHAWGEYLVHDANGNTIQPQHQLLLLLDYEGATPPTDAERRDVEEALRTVERAYQRGTGGNPSAVFHDGLLFFVGYGPGFFERFDAPLPDTVDLPTAESLLSELDDPDATADDYDAVLVLMSDYGSTLLSVEEALFGEADELNGLDAPDGVQEVFSVADRRTGFQGRGLPAKKLDVEEIEEDAPLSMGFKSGFAKNRPPSDQVSITDGAFRDGTTLMLSRLELELERWYDEKSLDERARAMFAPDLGSEEVGTTGEGLGNHSGITREHVEEIESHAKKHGSVGHSQKTARARNDDFVPVIHRVTEGITTDTPRPGFNFGSIQEEMSAFVDTREAMDSTDLDEHVDEKHHGILDYLEVTSRATFLVPPRGDRALPSPPNTVTRT